MYKTLVSLILASGSPRRVEMLTECGIEFKKIPADCDETVLPNEEPCDLVERLSHLKASTIGKQNPDEWVLGADTVVAIDGKILGKPANAIEAQQMLKQIQNRTHEVWSAFTLFHQSKEISHTMSSKTSVTLAPLHDNQISAYVATGEPMDKAGSYALQGIGGSFVTKLDGSYTNVIGLDLYQVIQTLERFGVVSVG